MGRRFKRRPFALFWWRLRWVGGVFAYSAESRKSALLLGKHLYLNGIGIHLLEKRGLQLG